MFNPDLRGVLKNHLSRYSLVTATAKRAREIAEDAEENKVIKKYGYKPKRNAICPCGSKKKYKNCCYNADKQL